jgi:hypothetical protein
LSRNTTLRMRRRFCARLYEEEKSWKKAAASYHSKTQEKGTRYVGRVYDSWQRLVEKLRVAKLQVPASSISEMKGMRPKQVANNTKTGVVYAGLGLRRRAQRRKAPLPRIRKAKNTQPTNRRA